MTLLQGVVAVFGGGGRAADLDRVGVGLAESGHAPVRRWRGDGVALAIAQRIATVEDRSERQPTRDPAGRVLLFDGMLFDREGTARDLGLDPALPDSRLAAAVLDRHGPGGLGQLAGDYALARWDPAERRLILAVAPMAMRLLHWHAGHAGFSFATTIAGLHRLPHVPRDPDPFQLAIHLAALPFDPGATAFKGVRALPPGTLLTVDAHGVQEEAFWRPDPTRRLRLRRDADYVAAARDILDRAVRVRLRAAAPVAATLTAGLDSSAVAATAARLLAPATLRAYTAVPAPGAEVAPAEGHYADERPGVEAIARMHPNILSSFHAADGPAALERDPTPLMLAGGAPVPLANHMGWFDAMYRAVRAAGHTVVLVGQAGNHTLSYDGAQGLGDMLRSGRIDRVAALLPALARYRGRSLLDEAKVALLYPLLPPRLRHRIWRKRNGGVSPWTTLAALRPEFAAAVRLDERLLESGQDAIRPFGADSRAMLVHLLHTRRVQVIRNFAVMRSHYGLEIRDPLADRELVEFCLAIPREQYLLDGRDRSLARRVLADRLPAAVIDDRRRGLQAPEWLARLAAQRAELAAEVERLGRVPLAAEMLDLPRLKAMLDNWPADAAAAGSRSFAYTFLLSRAIQMGRFIRWMDGSNA